MKAQKTFFIPFILLLFVLNLPAQVSIGPRLGVNIANQLIQDEDDETLETDPIAGLAAAALFEFQIAKVYALQLETGLVQKGYSLAIFDDYQIRLNYFDFAVLNKLEFGGDRVKGFVGMGPTFGFALSGKAETSIGDVTIDDWEGYRRFEIGLILNGGLEIKAGPGHVFFDPRILVGLTDVYDDLTILDSARSLNVGVGIGAGYLFQIGGN